MIMIMIILIPGQRVEAPKPAESLDTVVEELKTLRIEKNWAETSRIWEYGGVSPFPAEYGVWGAPGPEGFWRYPGRNAFWWFFSSENVSGSSNFYYFSVRNCYELSIWFQIIFEAGVKIAPWQNDTRAFSPLTLWSRSLCVPVTMSDVGTKNCTA